MRLQKNRTFTLGAIAASIVSSIFVVGSATSAEKPRFGDYGFDTSGMQKSVRPGDDFYKHLNGEWEKNTFIPADKSMYMIHHLLIDQSQKDTRAIIENAAEQDSTTAAASADTQKVANAYRAYMDTAEVEKRGITPLQPLLAAIDAISNQDELVATMTRLKREYRVRVPITPSVEQDGKNPDRYWVELSQSGLGMGNRDLYDTAKTQFEKQRAGYRAYLKTIFELAGFDKAEARATAVYALEEKIAQTHWTNVENRDPVKKYNPRSRTSLNAEAPGINWNNWLNGLGIPESAALGVNQPSALAKTAQLLKNEPLSTWQDYLRASTISGKTPLLPQRFVDAGFAFYGTVMSGTPENEARWKRAVDFTSESVTDAVSKLYVAKHFTPETKVRADELVSNLLKSMGTRIDNLSWMTAATKAKAKEKLATYNPKIGYPSTWKDYTTLEMKADDLFGNAVRAHAYEYKRELAKLGKPVDRNEWFMAPMDVNAYYNAQMNEIVFPAAFLQAPFFDPNADDAVNYGAIGAVIGHEISHGFDDKGRQYDAKGALNDWWTKADAERYKKATDKLAAQYSRYCPFDKLCVNGKLTLGENISDLAGLTVAYDAYQLSLKGKPAAVIAGRTGDQRFFEGYGQSWRSLVRDEAAKNRLATDVHSPEKFRVQTVRNFELWYKTFGVKPGDKLYLKPEERVRIW
jgi:putative endopeptidase